jgi:Fe2+ transport system protein FeoA
LHIRIGSTDVVIRLQDARAIHLHTPLPDPEAISA